MNKKLILSIIFLTFLFSLILILLQPIITGNFLDIFSGSSKTGYNQKKFPCYCTCSGELWKVLYVNEYTFIDQEKIGLNSQRVFMGKKTQEECYSKNGSPCDHVFTIFMWRIRGNYESCSSSQKLPQDSNGTKPRFPFFPYWNHV